MLEFVTWWPFVTVGTIVVGRALWDAWAVLYTLINNRFFPKSLPDRYGRDSYVLITGSTDGLGKAFALDVARRGLNLVLVSRNQAKLEATRKEINAVYPKTKIEVFALDFSGLFKPNKVAELAQFTQNLDISVVVNNVGVGAENIRNSQFFFQKDPQSAINMVSTNVLSQLLMHLHFGKRLSARSGRSAFLDVSSIAVSTLHPCTDVYAATKAFNWYFTTSIRFTRPFPSIDYLSYRPGMILTNMLLSSKVNESISNSFLTKSAATAAGEALDALGVVSNTNGNLVYFLVQASQDLMNYFEWTPVGRVLWDNSVKSLMSME